MRYLITGGSGYIGSRLTNVLEQREETERIVNLDVRPPSAPGPKSTFVRADVRNSSVIREQLESEKVDCLIHLAFILNPLRDEGKMYDIDVNGTGAVLGAAAEAGTGQVLVTSSASAYGAFPDNPRPIAEDWPVRGAPEFAYARDKADADRACQLWAAQHPDRVMTIVRPCIVFGPNVDNYLVRSWENAPFFPIVDGVEEHFQLVHEDDLVDALIGLLDGKSDGAFNVAGDGTMTWREAAEKAGVKPRNMSFKLAKRIGAITWGLRLPTAETPPGNLHFIRYPWLVSNEKLKAEIGWKPKHTTRETFDITLTARGGPKGAATPAPSGAPVA